MGETEERVVGATEALPVSRVGDAVGFICRSRLVLGAEMVGTAVGEAMGETEAIVGATEASLVLKVGVEVGAVAA